MKYTPISILLTWIKDPQSKALFSSVSPSLSMAPGLSSLDCLKAQRSMFDSPENKFKVAIGKAQERYGNPGPNPHRIPGHI
jgi:hypothetical protein